MPAPSLSIQSMLVFTADLDAGQVPVSRLGRFWGFMRDHLPVHGQRFQGGLGAENLLDQVGMIGVEFAPETGGERWTNLGPAVNR